MKSRQAIPLSRLLEEPRKRGRGGSLNGYVAANCDIKLSENATRKCRGAIQAVADGCDLMEASRKVGLSLQALKTYLTKFYKTNNFNSLAHAVATGFREGWVK